MQSNEILLLGEGDKEIIDFLEKARATNGLRVSVGTDVFVVKVTNDTVTQAGREFLTKTDRAPT